MGTQILRRLFRRRSCAACHAKGVKLERYYGAWRCAEEQPCIERLVLQITLELYREWTEKKSAERRKTKT